MIVLVFCSLISCDSHLVKPIPVKPFVIYSKENKVDNYFTYYFVDKNGNKFTFTEDINKYSIGDTIK